MKKPIDVLIIEDDPYSSEFMRMLLVRDWRTRVVGVIKDQLELDLLNHTNHPMYKKIDLMVIDTEFSANSSQLFNIIDNTLRWDPKPKILCTTTNPDSDIIKALIKYENFRGYLLKNEIIYSIATAVCLANADYLLFSPTAYKAAFNLFKETSEQMLIIDGNELNIPEEIYKKNIPPKESEILNLGLLFNLVNYDIKDELSITKNWVKQAIHLCYLKLGLEKVITDNKILEYVLNSSYFDNQLVIDQIEKMKVGNRNDQPSKECAAFYLYTSAKVHVPRLSDRGINALEEYYKDL